MLSFLIRTGVGCLIAAIFFIGCEAETSIPLDPPEGWTASDGKWWREGADTSVAFRKLETLQEMQVVGGEVTYLSNPQMLHQAGALQTRVNNAVKQSLIKLYRNQPEVVDSLFERYVVPEIQKRPVDGDVKTYVEQIKRRAYELIRSHFREPILATQLGKDVPLPPLPDSLEEQQVAGTVRLQLYLDQEGKPVAIERLAGVHPVLDAIATRAATQMEWSPAYYLRSGNWRPGPSWVRYNVIFRAPPES